MNIFWIHCIMMGVESGDVIKERQKYMYICMEVELDLF